MATKVETSDEGKADAGVKKPTLLQMVLQALAANKTSKGLSIQAIKKAVITDHPDTQENFSNKRLQTAVKKGLESSEIIRPKSSEQEGLKGYFLLNRTLVAQNAKKKKVNKTTSKVDGTEKPKKNKSTKEEKSEKSKERKVAKTKKPKDTKEATTKSKVAKKKPLATKASNSSTKSTPKTAKRRESMLSTPKISKADKTKAGTAASKRKFLSKSK